VANQDRKKNETCLNKAQRMKVRLIRAGKYEGNSIEKSSRLIPHFVRYSPETWATAFNLLTEFGSLQPDMSWDFFHFPLTLL
jgi:hypothetical protein